MACSNNNQAQLHAHVSVLPYWPPDVWLGLYLLRDIQFGLPAISNSSLDSYQSVVTINTCVMNALTWPEVGVATQIFSSAFRVPVAEPPFLNFWIRHCQLLARRVSLIVGLKQTMEFLCKANGTTSSFFCPFPLFQTSEKTSFLQVRLLASYMLQ